MMMTTGFEVLEMRQIFSPGDLLLNRPSARFQSPLYRLAWRLYPRGLAKKLGRRLGLFLLISARKPRDVTVCPSSLKTTQLPGPQPELRGGGPLSAKPALALRKPRPHSLLLRPTARLRPGDLG
jgi:hypothetical protein